MSGNYKCGECLDTGWVIKSFSGVGRVRAPCACPTGVEAGNLPHDEPEKAHCTQPRCLVGVTHCNGACHGVWPDGSPKDASTVPSLMEEAAQTFRKRNAEYKDNKDNVGGVMLALFPEGIDLRTKEDYIKWHLFELMVVKMTRYANSGMTHKDSIHDLGIYAFMVEKETK